MAHVRTVVVSAGQVLLVQHHDPRDDVVFWMPPGGGSEEGEAMEDAARREVKEETGVDVRVVRQVPVPAERGHLLFEAQLVGAPDVTPEIEPCGQEIHTTGAAWHRVTAEAPLGPMQHAHWGELAPLIRALLGREPGRPRACAVGEDHARRDVHVVAGGTVLAAILLFVLAQRLGH